MERDLALLLKEAAPAPQRPPAPEAARRRAGRIRSFRRTVGGAATLALVAAAVVLLPGLLTERVDTVLSPGPGRAQMTIFLSDDITPSELADVDAELSGEPNVISYYYQSKVDSYELFRDEFGDDPALLESVDEDDFPASFRAVVTDATAARQIEHRLSGMRGIDAVQVAPAEHGDQGNPPEGFGFQVSGQLVEDASWLLDLDAQSAQWLGRWRARLQPIEGADLNCIDGSAVQREQLRAGWAVQAHIVGVEPTAPPSLLPSLRTTTATVGCP